ncbi:transposase [Alkaliphilus serpentinus]|uniref:Transposase n=1 Tax=Alkaliphilus serpentinus TaxID=1482731 RepID=A0A833HMF4_9FIRM|nr:transposase [Alkaliphilus serpentinus]KAB3527514.1 transposase [Alkaliphilus serpentinus]
MPRKAREKSESGLYHIILRGINKQIIFEDEEDKKKFLQTLKDYKDKRGYKVYGYCLMGNHIHIILHEIEEGIEIVMKSIGASYVYWYNWKYNRSGHLFQDRYKSEPIEDEGYLLTALRYIHQNPLKAGITDNIEDFQWSSYREYVNKEEIVDTDYILKMLDSDRKTAIEKFIAFHKDTNEEKCLDIEKKRRLTDKEGIEIIKRVCKVNNCLEIQQIEQDMRNKYLKKLKEEGLSTRQIARLTGISRGIVLKS